ncbi:centromere protein S-like isoform X2 [Cryptotermes secundus]|nr:centromere protein S-like isoform X2 [Cryptotermes secundus]XP_023727200.1 centromere protein S-like isoform X2 [Cryptotermes secundus]
MCREVGGQIKMELDKDAVSVIAELVWRKMCVISQDLEHFAKHAKRSTINAEDVKLLARRNPSLRAIVCRMADDAVKKKRQNKEKATEDLS